MTMVQQVRCDICGNILDENEFQQKQPVMGFGGKPKSKSSLIHIHDGQKASGDLCYACSKEIKDFREKLKLKARK